VIQVKVPWGEEGSRFTAMFEAITIDWLKEASLSAVARRLGLSWSEASGIQARAVKRGLARRAPWKGERIGVDETSSKKGHKYVTIVSDIDDRDVLYVADGRKKESLEGFYKGLTPDQLARISVVALDMGKPFISATREHVPNADEKIAFDRFHVAQHLGDAVDKVRREEHAALLREGDFSLTGTKYIWLKNPENHSATAGATFDLLKGSALKTAKAWWMKEQARQLWGYGTRFWVKRLWNKWIAWVMRSKLEPMKHVARMVKEHLQGIVNAVVLQATNAGSESINAKIQKVKHMGCGYRNDENFRNAIYFHFGGLDLYPEGCRIR
jgi:transposase